MLLVLPPPWLLPLHLPLLPGLLVPPLVLHLQPFWVANMLAGWAWAPLLFLVLLFPLLLRLAALPLQGLCKVQAGCTSCQKILQRLAEQQLHQAVLRVCITLPKLWQQSIQKQL
jgi:hypothetical protein